MSDQPQNDSEFFYGSGNVFADLGLPDADELFLKAELAAQIVTMIQARGWTQKHAATVLGIKQPDVSNITRARLDNFSAERLMHFLSMLGRRVAVTLSEGGLPPEEFVIEAAQPAVPTATASRSQRQVRPAAAEAEARP